MAQIESKRISICVVFLLQFLVFEVNSQYPAASGQSQSHRPVGLAGLSSQLLLSLLRGIPRDPPICNFGCPTYGQVPTQKANHVPQSNGCGSYGFERLLIPEMDFFVDCCNAHDICYDTCGATKLECDQAFQFCLLQRCSNLAQSYTLPAQVAGNCLSTAQVLGTGPTVAGCNAFIVAQTNACQCS